jgi:HK97 family phage prohead protease
MTMPHPIHARGSTGEFLCRQGSDFQVPAGGPDLSIRTVRADEDGSGSFEGWGCVFDVVDTYGTTFRPGCFTRGGLDEGEYALLWMHSPMVPVGVFTAEERDQGLWITGRYDPTPDGQAARVRGLSGSASGLSVGFVWLDDGGEDAPDDITSARLVETSQITARMAAVPGSALQGVRDDALDEAERKRVEALLSVTMLTSEV